MGFNSGFKGLKQILQKQDEMAQTGFIWLRTDKWWDLVNIIIKVRVPQNAANFLTRRGPITIVYSRQSS